MAVFPMEGRSRPPAEPFGYPNDKFALESRALQC